MDITQSLDGNLVKIKDKLNQTKVKLWLNPFYTESEGTNKDEMKNLATNFSAELSISFEECLHCLNILQKKALDNLRERNTYQNTGLATLKVRIPNEQRQAKIITITIDLTKSGKILTQTVSEEVSVPNERIKIIFQGKILKDEESLISQGVKHGVHVMAIILSDNSDFLRQESHMQLLSSTKADVRLLVENELDEDYLQVADQSGKLLNLPSKERKALILAMTLHEKGRAAMKAESFSLALVMLLEAEKEFSFCNSLLLKSVDNYGILNLDIVWCYLNLQSVTQLPDAEERLHQCELSFQQSYGLNLEKLIILKGSAGNENALFLRLHLLQSIVLYHQNKFDEAERLITKVEQELKYLKVDDVQLSHLMELGYTIAEARLALRESKGDINNAVNIIEKKKEEKIKNKEVAEKERILQREKKKLGKCVNGEWVDLEFHKAMMAMGYSYQMARWALAQSCNSICNGINIIKQHPEYLPKGSASVTKDLIEQVSQIGFDSKMAKLALKKYEGDVSKAVEELVVNDGTVIDFTDSSSESESDDSGPSTSKREHDEAYLRVAQGISTYEEDYLDLNLIAETAFMKKYKDLLSKR